MGSLRRRRRASFFHHQEVWTKAAWVGSIRPKAAWSRSQGKSAESETWLAAAGRFGSVGKAGGSAVPAWSSAIWTHNPPRCSWQG
jgi:hypothetical protein